MMELFQKWLTGITCVALVVALADSLTPAGTVRKIGRMVGGLLLLAAVVKPVLSVDFSILAVSNLHLEVEELENTNLDLMKTIIGEETGAYILDKAAELGISCQAVVVTCAVGEEGVPYPAAVTITGTMGDGERQALSRRIEADLAIPVDCQTYESGGGGA